MSDDDETTPGPLDEWAEDAPTRLDAVPLDALVETHPTEPAPHETTAPHAYEILPGYEAGRARGRIEGRGDVIEEVLTAFRLAQMQGGTDPGVAHLLAEKLRRWMEVAENQQLVRAVMRR